MMHLVIIARCQFSVEGGLSTITKITCIKLQLSSIYTLSVEDHILNTDGISLLDIAFVDDEALILLIKNESKILNLMC